MKPWLSKSASTLKEQINASFPDRDKSSDGWLGDYRHSTRSSDHNPDPKTGAVRAVDIDADLTGKNVKPSLMPYLAEQLRLLAKNDSAKRVSYIIFAGKIASSKRRWAWRTYTGINQHNHHCHISFNESADQNTDTFDIPMLGA